MNLADFSKGVFALADANSIEHSNMDTIHVGDKYDVSIFNSEAENAITSGFLTFAQDVLDIHDEEDL